MGGLGMRPRDGFAPDAEAVVRSPLGTIETAYDYRDETGALLFQVVRFEPKTFRQRRPDPSASDGWSWKLDGVPRVLYQSMTKSGDYSLFGVLEGYSIS